MARKRSNLIEDPPTASSSEEEEEEKAEASSEEEEGSSSGEEDEEEEEEPRTQTAPQTQKAPPPKKPEIAAVAPVADESEESGSDDDSESESDTDTPTPNVKPIATKPMEETSNAKKPRSKPLTSPVKATSAKRPSESEQESKEAKRPKKKAGDEGTGSAAASPAVVEEVKKTGEDPKKQLFQRLFSEDDEIAVLRGMLDYHGKKGADPCADMNAFYDFVKKSIHTDVTKAQLMDKIRRLRKKFENNAVKGKKGEDKVFTKPHEQYAFDLSKKIWGKEGISGKVESSVVKSNGKAKGNNSKASATLKAEMLSSPEKKVVCGVPMDVDKESKTGVSFFDKWFGVANLEEKVLKHGLEVVEGEKRAVLEQKWKKLQIAELELFLERSDLIREQAKMLLEFYKSEDK